MWNIRHSHIYQYKYYIYYTVGRLSLAIEFSANLIMKVNLIAWIPTWWRVENGAQVWLGWGRSRRSGCSQWWTRPGCRAAGQGCAARPPWPAGRRSPGTRASTPAPASWPRPTAPAPPPRAPPQQHNTIINYIQLIRNV